MPGDCSTQPGTLGFAFNCIYSLLEAFFLASGYLDKNEIIARVIYSVAV